MPNIPSICLNPACGLIFPSGVIVERTPGAEKASEPEYVEFINCSGAACPKCGSEGRIPNGRYDIFGETLFAMLHDVADTEIIRQSIAVIKTNIAAQATPEKIAEEMTKAAPELQTLWDCIPKTRVEAYAFITLLILVLTKFIDYYPSLKSPNANTTVIQQQIINQSFQQFYAQDIPAKPAIQRDSHNKKKKKQQRKMKKDTQRKSKKK
ncbi:MAG: hypothetical protein ACHQ0Y_12575 [Thermodesulfovibrionales bacterium]